MVVQAAPVTSSTVVVAVDVGKTEFAFSVTDVSRTSLLTAWSVATSGAPTSRRAHPGDTARPGSYAVAAASLLVLVQDTILGSADLC